jgi:putative transposase
MAERLILRQNNRFETEFLSTDPHQQESQEFKSVTHMHELTPYGLFLAGLAGCTSIVLHTYAQNHGLDLQVVQYREPVFRDPKVVMLFREILHNVNELHPFSMLGYVFLPDHFHVTFQPLGKSNFSDIMHSLKPNFTKEYKKLIDLAPSQSLKFWQKRFWDHVIRDDRDFENHLHYIHCNPVKHGYVSDPRDWKDSSYIEWEKRGLYPSDFRW